MIRLVGRSLRGWRAGPDHRVVEDPRFAYAPRELVLASEAFADGQPLPEARGSPPLAWSGVPAETHGLALVVEDIDVPFPRPFVHAIAYAIDPARGTLGPGALDDPATSSGYNGLGRRGWLDATPLPGHGKHRYVFTLLAIDFAPRFDQPPTRGRLLDALAGHVLALGELTGTRVR